jgi:hypothetical protein
MSTDLLQRLADYRADLDGAIEAQRAATWVVPVEMSRSPRRRVMLAVAVLALIAGGIGLVVAVNREGSSNESVSGVDETSLVSATDSIPATSVPSTTVDTEATWDWLAQFGAEVPQPLTPDGWKILDFERFRFAVPADWTVPISRSCAIPTPTGVVLISASTPETTATCGPEQPLPESVLTIGRAVDEVASGVPTTVGTLSAMKFPPKCIDCPPVYLFDTPYQVTVSGPEAEQVLATFTDSGSRRVLQSGAVADTSSWQTVDYKGIAFRIPEEWPVVDLPASYNEATQGNGAVQVSAQSDPGICGGAMFPSNRGAQVALGTSPLVPSCAPVMGFDVAPGDGMWMRSTVTSLAQLDGTPIAHGVVDGLDVTVVRPDRTNGGTPSPVLDLIVKKGETTIWVSLGVGTDTSIARSILRSLHAA